MEQPEKKVSTVGSWVSIIVFIILLFIIWLVFK